MADRGPTVSITIATWNGTSWLPALFESIAAQSFTDYELVIVDDASTDDTAAWLRSRFGDDPRAHVTVLADNRGYVHAQNLAISQAQGEAVLVLNQDVELDDRFLELALDVLRTHPEASAVQGRVLRLGRDGQRTTTVDSTGLEMHRDRRVVSRDQGDEDTARRATGPVWGVDGPAGLYRRDALLDVRQPDLVGGWEILDSDFGMQKEDADLAWRLRRAGWEAWYEPEAVAWHARSGADSGGSGVVTQLRSNMSNPLDTRVMAWRNQRLMQLKNDEAVAVLRDLPWIIRRELAMLTWMVARDQRRLRAVGGFVRLAPRALRRRRALARSRRRRAT